MASARSRILRLSTAHPLLRNQTLIRKKNVARP